MRIIVEMLEKHVGDAIRGISDMFHCNIQGQISDFQIASQTHCLVIRVIIKRI